YPPSCGRGYGETKLMDYAMSHSETLSQLQEDDRVWKMTGRYVLQNLPALIAGAPDRYDLYCDLKNRPMHWFDMRVYSFTRPGYERLLRGIYPRLSEAELHCSPEVEMHRYIAGKLPDAGIIPRFRVEPR